MKKLSFILGVLIITGLSSCMKESDCKCVTSSTGSPDMTSTMKIKGGKCSDSNSSVSSNGINITTTCTEE